MVDARMEGGEHASDVGSGLLRETAAGPADLGYKMGFTMCLNGS